MSDEYKKGYADGFKDGHKAGQELLNELFWRNHPPESPAYGCSVCGMNWKDGAMGYVCYNLRNIRTVIGDYILHKRSVLCGCIKAKR
jgi:hypothetical protein